MLFTEIMKKRHVEYMTKHLGNLPQQVSSSDTNRFALIFFALSGLELFDAVDNLSEETKKEMIEWIYHYQLIPNNDEDLKKGTFGFSTSSVEKSVECCNITMTYCGLSSLLILGDDLSRVHRDAIIQGLKFYQKDSGNFIQAFIEEEDDLRITYSTATICYILDDWSAIDTDKMAQYVKNCLTYEYGFGQTPGNEAHGGVTYCALASLFLMNKLDQVLSKEEIDNIIQWCLHRQVSGFQGRVCKEPDSCYSFWIGASLYFLDSFGLVNDKYDRSFLGSTQDLYGGFAKHPDSMPDIMHTFLSVSAMSLRVSSGVDTESTDVLPVFPALNISERAVKHLRSLHKKWAH